MPPAAASHENVYQTSRESQSLHLSADYLVSLDQSQTVPSQHHQHPLQQQHQQQQESRNNKSVGVVACDKLLRHHQQRPIKMDPIVPGQLRRQNHWRNKQQQVNWFHDDHLVGPLREQLGTKFYTDDTYPLPDCYSKSASTMPGMRSSEKQISYLKSSARRNSTTASRNGDNGGHYGNGHSNDMYNNGHNNNNNYSDLEPLMLMYDTSSPATPPEFIHLSMTPPIQHYLTIEDLKSSRNSCWLCGCNWQEDHVSLDCPECGGYALSRPCPSCDGKCKQVWKRNLNGTHDHHKAIWTGQCTLTGATQSAAAKGLSCCHL